ncbi:NAD(P)/FAD-dependent oxidoreductase [Saccharothrix variisporea]|uniref:NADH dehydrogenase FAD-containing subunit n=1 Tax=Saccharothrix variisporea TaxID=543527 RepID=A0A495X6A5_9PSEU|nr:FAD-dependent oxidoreductase [Saccharothrix variisporea]RKT69059.1 NADH dehydrogenase FAD-containing subunit [Saccharothrix variisporea]
MSTVVVIGGGYGGSAVAKALDAEADVVLVEPRDAFVNAAGSLRALTRPDWAGNLFFPYDALLTRGRVVRDRAVSVDPRGVTLASGERIEADHLVLATGSSYTYPGKPSAESTADALDDLRRTHKELADAGHVLIAGAGPVGLELAGEIKEVWPDKRVTVVDPGAELMPGFLPQMREELHKALAERDIEVRLGTSVTPSVEPGRLNTFTAGDITADIWFRAHGVRINSGYLADGRLTTPGPRGTVAVTSGLNVVGYDHVYALGDLADLPEAKMAGYAMQHAEVVAANISARLRGEEPTATYDPAPHPMILLPLGSRGGVGQFPSPDGPFVVPVETVVEYKGADLFTGRFAAQFGIER